MYLTLCMYCVQYDIMLQQPSILSLLSHRGGFVSVCVRDSSTNMLALVLVGRNGTYTLHIALPLKKQSSDIGSREYSTLPTV